jgi:ATP-dependent Clp protease protease subunit
MTCDRPEHDRLDAASHAGRVLFDTRTVLLSGEVNDRQASQVVTQLLVLNEMDRTRPIRLLINSGGGAISSGFAIYDAIRYITAPVQTVGTGLIASMGVTIFLAVPRERRFSLGNARYMIHQPLIAGTVVAPASDLEINAREMIKLKDRLNHLISEATDQPVSKVEKDTMRDYWMDAQEAMTYGIVGRIIQTETDLA